METYLAHHGILGQKWGVRRFQNEDGSYTAAGKKRENAQNKKNAVSLKAAGARTMAKIYDINAKNLCQVE